MINDNEEIREREERIKMIKDAVSKVQDKNQELNFEDENKRLKEVWDEL